MTGQPGRSDRSAGGVFARLVSGAVGRVVLAGLCVAVVVSGLAVPPLRSWLVSAAGAGSGQGLKVSTGPVVKVGKGSPGSPQSLTHEPGWKPRPVKVPVVGSARVTPGKGFRAAGSLPVAVADAATGEAVVAPARQAERERRARVKVSPPARPAQQSGPAGEAPRSASSAGEAWLDLARRAPGVPTVKPAPVPADPDKGSYTEVPGKAAPDAGAAALARELAVPDPVTAAPQAGAGESAGPVTVTTLDQGTVAALGGRFLGFTVQRESGTAPVSVSVDYSSIADAYGADFGGRLRLVSFPPCAVTTPEVAACQVATPVVGVNDEKAQRITAVVATDAATTTATSPTPSLTPSGSPSPDASVPVNPSVSPTTTPATPTAVDPGGEASGAGESSGSSVTVTEQAPTTSTSAPVVDESDTQVPGLTGAAGTVGVEGSVQDAGFVNAGFVKAGVQDFVARAATGEQAGVRAAAQAGVRAGVASVGAAVLALESAPSSSAGSYSATGLQASMGWDVGVQTGTFTYGVNLPFVPSPAGDEPDVGLRYSSADVDGMTSTENPQGSEAGAGWAMSTPFIERRYAPCKDNSGNLCWAGHNATLNLDGQSGTLVWTHFGDPDPNSGVRAGFWRMENDQGWKVEQVQPGNAVNNNGDANGEYWKITSTDGTQYYFGREDPAWGAATNSTMRLPLYGQAVDDTCWPQAGHMCQKAWRWNLAYVVDAHGNMQRYTWEKEQIAYAINGGAPAQRYDSSAHLARVEYGFTTATATGPAPARTVFEYGWRCTQGSCQGPAADPHDWYPDVPFDLWCRDGASTCPNGPSTPVFFALKRINTVSSQYWTGQGYRAVEMISLAYTYPARTGSPAAQFLTTVTRSGLDGARIDLPAVSFQEVFLPNRWKPASGQSAIEKPRIGVIKNEFGGLIRANYWQPDPCDSQTLTGREDVQTTNCYARRDNDGSIGWFRKWLVGKVEIVDAYGAPTQTTEYVYDDVSGGGQGPIWHSDNDPIAAPETQLWGDYRGYAKVNVMRGVGDRVTVEEFSYLRGMHGDYLKNGSTRAVTLYTAEPPAADISRVGYVDYPWLRGRVFEHRVHRVHSRWNWSELSSEQTIFDSFEVSGGPLGPHGIQHHPIVQTNVASTTTMTKQGNTYRALKHTTRAAYDHVFNRRIWTQDDGDPATGIGPSCDYTVYGSWKGTPWMPNTDTWIIDAPRQELSTSTACPATVTEVPTANLIGRQDLYYGYSGDEWTKLTEAPATSEVTKTVEYSDAATPFKYTATRYDTRGRVTGQIAPDNFLAEATTFAAAGKVKTTAYTETNGLVAGTVETDENNGVITTILEPGRQSVLSETDQNGQVTRLTYDALGRLTSARLPGDEFDVKKFTYTVSNTTPSMIRADQYSSAGAAPISMFAVLDSLGRSYQSQVGGPNGQRIVSGTRYDERGNPTASVAEFGAAGTLGTVVPDWYQPSFTNTIPSTTLTTYDDVNRAVTQSQIAAGPVTRWTATTSYDGLTTTTTPPSNVGAFEPDVAATAVTTDLYGRQITKVQGNKTSRYSYDVAGNLATMTSPLVKLVDGLPTSVTTHYSYDWLGRRTITKDPDSGTSTADYYPSGKLKHTHDALGQDLFNAIDVLGRTVATYNGKDTTGTQLTETLYDGIPLDASMPLKGSLTSQTSWDNGVAYTLKFGYDQRNRVVRTDQTIPAVTGSPIQHLAGTYTTTSTYDALDRPTSISYPAVGGLDAETVTTGYTNAYSTTLTSPLGSYVSNTSYAESGLLTARTLGIHGSVGSIRRTNTWDEATGRLTNQAAATPSTAGTANVQNDTYSYAPTGQITKITDGVVGQQQCYTYDTLNRLVAALTSATNTATGSACTADNTGPSPYQESYTYDDDANLTSLVSRGITSTYGYGANTSLGLTGGVHAPTTVTKNGATTNYTYDAKGQLTERVNGASTTTYSWNTEGRLTSVTDDKGTSNFVDGPDGTRWIRTTPTETVAYLAGQELHIPVGATSATAVRYYAHNGTTVAVRKAGPNGGLSWTLGDRQGSATVAVSATTGAATRDRYLPYGGNRDSTNVWTLPTDRGWLGQTQDKDTELNYLNARYYDPALAHFISTDPLNDQTSPQHANPYGYAAANPITYSDPTGLAVQYNTLVIKAGDNWEKIAKDYKVTYTQLRQWNGSLRALKKNDIVRVGISAVTKGPLPSKRPEGAGVKSPTKPKPGLVPVAPPVLPRAPAGGGLLKAMGWLGAVLMLGGDSSPAQQVATNENVEDEPVNKSKRKNERVTYITYTLINKAGTVYSGRASGYGTPDQIFKARLSGHHMLLNGYAPVGWESAVVATRDWQDRRQDKSYQAIRGREQQLIDKNGGARSEKLYQGTSGNSIRGVARDNPAGRLYWNQSNAHFGEIHAYTGL